MPPISADWIPRPRADLDLSSLDLQPEEGFVLSRLDGATQARQLPFLTGLSADRVEGILDRLVSVGVVPAPEPAAAEPAGAEPAAAEPDDGAQGLDEGNWRRYFERELRPRPLDWRVEQAALCPGSELRCFCFDPSPKVAAAVLENPELGLEHARLLARHHRSSQGLGALGQEQAFLRDRQVQRELFRNPQTPDALLHRIFHGTRLDQLHALATGHDATERVRRASKQAFRQRFSRASADERVQMILKSEGRCLAMLQGLPLDGKAAALLCRRPLGSMLLIRNLARWPSTPPPVLQHLARQPVVRRNVDLKNQILRHANAPKGL